MPEPTPTAAEKKRKKATEQFEKNTRGQPAPEPKGAPKPPESSSDLISKGLREVSKTGKKVFKRVSPFH